MKKALAVLAVILVVGGLLWWFQYGRAPEVQATFDKDTVIEEDFTVEEGKQIVLKNSAKLTVTGNLNALGDIACEEGALRLAVNGTTKLGGSLTCIRPEEDGETANGVGIALSIGKGLVIDENAKVISNGHVILTDSEETIPQSSAALERLYDEAGKNSGTGNRIGPLVDADETSSGNILFAGTPGRHQPTVVHTSQNRSSLLIRSAFAQGVPSACVDNAGNPVPNCVRLSGTWVIGSNNQAPPPRVNVPTPPKGVNKIILNFNFGPANEVHLENLTLSGPDGRDGQDDKNQNCSARGGKGENAFRLLVAASNIVVNNFDLWLGNGGKGGDAETTRDCDPGVATGGEGGEPGNFKMVATGTFDIKEAFNIYPGAGGEGGEATAYGKNGIDGCPGAKGGDATATGGNGGRNKKELSVTGTVAGTGNVTVGNVNGGDGGRATAHPGKGGNGNGCGCNGGRGGTATANAGRGGNAASTVLGSGGKSRGGDGGDASSRGGDGGAGGACDHTGPGGNGGSGGDATAKPGSGGTGEQNGEEGSKDDETGGNGGNGGDGCGPGTGGKGGKGTPPGKDGGPGKNTCLPTPSPAGGVIKDGSTVQTPSPTPQVASPSPTPKRATPTPSPKKTTIKVIQYAGTYIPLSELITEGDEGPGGCGELHYHAVRGVANAANGEVIPDPGPPCGYGTAAGTPVMNYAQ